MVCSLNNSPNNGNNRRPSDASYNLDYDANAGRTNPPQRQPQNPGQGQRPPLTDDERRRLAAARAARMRMENGQGQNPRPNPNGNGQVRRDANGRPVQPRPVNGQGQRPNVQRRPAQVQESLTRRKKRKIKINAGAIIFVLIVGAVIGVSAYQISQNPDVLNYTGDLSKYDSIIADAQANIAGDLFGGNGNETASSETAETPENPETSPVSEELPVSGGLAFETVQVPSSSVNEGDLVLVNYNHAYDRIDDVELKIAYTERTGKIKVSSTTLGMEPEAFDALEQMVIGLVADTECDDLLLYSGHRTLADQQRIWDSNMTNYGEDYTRTYVAVPAHSEHHTGYACDLGFYTDDGASIPLVDHEFGPWVWEHCTEYGYILRYPAEKAEITGIGHEQWHFRYVGIAHAYAMDTLGFCLEEYIDHIKAYTTDAQLVHIGADRSVNYVLPSELADISTGWIAYYVPASDGDTTDIQVPDAAKYANYEISGNNVDGFIVTVTLG